MVDARGHRNQELAHAYAGDALAAVDGEMRTVGVAHDLAAAGRQELVLRIVERSPVVRAGVDVGMDALATAHDKHPIVAIHRQEAARAAVWNVLQATQNALAGCIDGHGRYV